MKKVNKIRKQNSEKYKAINLYLHAKNGSNDFSLILFSTNVSSSQANFFKMLDEKIENVSRLF